MKLFVAGVLLLISKMAIAQNVDDQSVAMCTLAQSRAICNCAAVASRKHFTDTAEKEAFWKRYLSGSEGSETSEKRLRDLAGYQKRVATALTEAKQCR